MADYIDAYWVTSSEQRKITKEKILPDGCVDIILNTDSDCKVESENFVIKWGEMYLVGAMTLHKITLMCNTNRLMGIRFKPGTLNLFSTDCKLDGLTNQTIEMEDTWLPEIRKLNFTPDGHLWEIPYNPQLLLED